jgi:hypothetical protein
MNCKCITEIDAKLKDQNLSLNCLSWVMPSFTAVVTLKTEWIDDAKAPKGKKRRPPGMFACYCPFCGVKIELPKGESEEVPVAAAS